VSLLQDTAAAEIGLWRQQNNGKKYATVYWYDPGLPACIVIAYRCLGPTDCQFSSSDLNRISVHWGMLPFLVAKLPKTPPNEVKNVLNFEE
jgi:hypothetical protein